MADKQTRIPSAEDYLERVGMYFTEKKEKKQRIEEWKKKRDEKLPDINTFGELFEMYKERKEENKEKQRFNLQKEKRDLKDKHQ